MTAEPVSGGRVDVPGAQRRGGSKSQRASKPKKPTKTQPDRTSVADAIRELGAMFMLLFRSIRRGCRPPFDIAPELVTQLRFTVGIAWLPLLLMSFSLAFGPAGVQASGFLGIVGAMDRLGGTYVLITVREIAPLATSIILAGVAGTAICADIGARVVRGEIDALEVLGVDTVKSIVAPRMFVLVATSVIFMPFALAAGMLGAVVVVLQNHSSLGPFWATFFSNATALELAAAFVKCALFGALIATVCCYKGLNVSGGPEGVGRAVNQSVVICFLVIGFFDYAFTQALLATNPILSVVRG
jgi:phospholipid/cholesterol/gamma-HCH transport system permease protein